MTTIQCPVCSREVEFRIKRQPIDIPGVLKEYIQCPKCPYTKNVSYTTLEIIEISKEIIKLDSAAAKAFLDQTELHPNVATKRKNTYKKLFAAKQELAIILNEQSRH